VLLVWYFRSIGSVVVFRAFIESEDFIGMTGWSKIIDELVEISLSCYGLSTSFKFSAWQLHGRRISTNSYRIARSTAVHSNRYTSV
jgi:hypothetical protein